MIEGRPFTAADTNSANPVFIINETFARHYWPKESAFAIVLRFVVTRPPPWGTIVGVVADVRERGYDIAMTPGIY
jgi:putative ABC transport system permease protein